MNLGAVFRSPFITTIRHVLQSPFQFFVACFAVPFFRKKNNQQIIPQRFSRHTFIGTENVWGFLFLLNAALKVYIQKQHNSLACLAGKQLFIFLVFVATAKKN